MQRLFAILVLVAGSLMMSGNAVAQGDESPCVAGEVATYSTQVNNRDDSGDHGTWAKDNFVRTIVVTNNCNGTYTLNISDTNGTFTTIDGALSPGAGVALAPSFVGEFYGGATITVTTDRLPSKPVMPADGWPSTGGWPALIFGGEVQLNDYPWGWTYNYCGEQWTNAAKGNSGDVTGKPCTAVPEYVVKVEAAVDCTPTSQAVVRLLVKIKGGKWHAPLQIPYWVNGKKEILTVDTGEVEEIWGVTSAEDAHNGTLKVVFGMGRGALRFKLNTNCIQVVPTTTSSAPTSTTSNSVATTTSTAAPIVNVGSKDDDLAYTGAAGIAPLIVTGGLLLVLGAAALLVLRLRRRRGTIL